jgi:hypothetical protein
VKRFLGLWLVVTVGCGSADEPSGTGGATNTGGAAGAPSGGSGGANTGGAPSGGSGGANTGGAPSGGSGGNPSGGSGGGTGGVPAGGAGGTPMAGGAWANVTANLAGIPSECGNLSFVTAHPDRDLLIAGVAQQGLWVSKDGATQWTQLGTGGGSAKITNRTSMIVFDPGNPDVFWESGIYNAGGVYRTNDGGLTFMQLGDVTHTDLVSVDLADPMRKTLFAGSHEQSQKAFLSTNGGMSWMDVGKMIPLGGFSSWTQVLDAKTLLVGSFNGQNTGIARSTDGGATFTKVYSGNVSSRPVVASDGTLYWAADNGVARSTDKGATWTKAAANNVGGAGSVSLLELPDGRLVSLGPQKLAISRDKAATWQSFGPDLPQQRWGLAYSKHRKAFYVWHFTCGCFTPMCQPVPADALMKLDFDYTK